LPTLTGCPHPFFPILSLSSYFPASFYKYRDEEMKETNSNYKQFITFQLCMPKIGTWDYNGTVHQLFINFKKAYDLVRRKVLHNTLNEFGIASELAGLIKMCLNETYSII
jgi:hypothetical protein